MILQGIDFGPVWCASGARGWFGEGYWFHKLIPGLDFSNSTFVSKTTTLNARKGNMLLNERGEAKERFPKCVVVNLRKGIVLNSVGLSGPGAEALLGMGDWQRREDPFFLSFMSVSSTIEDRLFEAHAFADLLNGHADAFCAPFGVQINLSCPNTGHDSTEIAKEAKRILEVFQFLRPDIPIVPKFNVLYPVEVLRELESFCDAICVSNTLPWGTLPAEVDWARLFGGEWARHARGHQEWIPLNPLKTRGIDGGGLSGAPLLPLVEEWVKAARGRGIDIPINAGGGILGPNDVDRLAKAGADSVFLGSIAILRGWRVRSTIRRAHKLLGR